MAKTVVIREAVGVIYVERLLLNMRGSIERRTLNVSGKLGVGRLIVIKEGIRGYARVGRISDMSGVGRGS